MNANDWTAQARLLIGRAVLAPSSHNTQPWLFRISQNAIDLYADRARALTVNDPEDRELAISCGCALMNLRLAAAASGLGTQIELLPSPSDADWLAHVTFTNQRAASAAETALAGVIERRRTYRKAFTTSEVDAATIGELAAAAHTEGAWLRPLLDAEARQQTAHLVLEGDAEQWRNPHWRQELAAWMRPRRSGDGLSVPALALPLTRLVVRTFDMGRRVGPSDRDLALTAPLLAVIGTDSDQPRTWLQAGQALERLLLVACRHGLQASYLNQPLQIARLRSRLRDLSGGGCPQILLRLGYPTGDIPPAPRRRIAAVIAAAA